MNPSAVFSRRQSASIAINTFAVARCLLLLCALIGIASAQAEQTPTAQSITVVFDDNYPPYAFRDDSGKLDGYLVDVWKLWEQKTGVPVHIVASDWAVALVAMSSGKADVIDTIFQTPERDSWLDFAPAYADIPVPIFTHASIGGIADLNTLHGFQIGVKDGDACADRLQAAGIDTVRKYESYSALIQGAVDSQIKIFCLDEPPADYLLYRAGVDQLFRKSFTLYSGQFHRAVHKGDAATLQLVERGFNAISPAELQAIHDKWMGSSLALVPWGRYLTYGLFAALTFGLVLAVWGILLRREVQRRTRQLEDERTRLRTVLRTLPDMVWLKDKNGIYLACNPVLERLFGADEKQILGKTDYDFVDAELADSFRTNDMVALEQGALHTSEKWLTFASDSYRGLFETKKIPMRDSTGNIIGVLGIAHDITALKQSQEALDFLAHHDALTHLPNRLLFRDRLEHALLRAQREHTQLALLFVDLDRFKNVNDALGHLAGDDLLREVALRMTTEVRSSDTLARLGGDEFVLLIEDNADAEQTANIAQKLLALFAKPWMVNGRSLFIGASIGISRYPNDGDDADTLIQHADMAMYRAKQEGRNAFRFFKAAQSSDAMERMLLENMLRGAIDRNELLLHYQPQIDMSNRALIGIEALVRWQHPELGLIPPNRFIPIAEEIGIIGEIGDWVFRECCRQLALWRALGIAIPRVSINLSVQQIEREDLATWVSDILCEWQLEPQHIELEVTESLLMQQNGRSMEVLDELEKLGVRLSVDDFGTGYSSLIYLKRMPVRCLKIDRSFIADIGRDAQGEVIVRAIIALAKSLSLDVIAEGVENAEQIQFLLGEDCRMAQGFFFSRPIPAHDIEVGFLTPPQSASTQ